MPEEEVTYADVRFKTPKATDAAASPSSDDTTYSEVRILKSDPPVSPNIIQQQTESNRKCHVTSKKAALLLLSLLLVAAVVTLGVTISNKMVSRRNHTESENDQPEDGKHLKCAAGWEIHGEKCYYFTTTKSSWNVSRAGCKDKGGDLVKIDSWEEQKFLEARLRDKMEEAEDKFWIGLTDSEEEGRWVWVDGSPLDTGLTFWHIKEPDDWKGENRENPAGEDCVRMGERGGAADLKCWFDKSCNVPHKSICEKSAETR